MAVEFPRRHTHSRARTCIPKHEPHPCRTALYKFLIGVKATQKAVDLKLVTKAHRKYIGHCLTNRLDKGGGLKISLGKKNAATADALRYVWWTMELWPFIMQAACREPTMLKTVCVVFS